MTEFPEATRPSKATLGRMTGWTDSSFGAIERRKHVERVCALKILAEKIPSRGLKGEERLNYDLTHRALALDIEGNKFGGEFLVLSHLGGLHLDTPDLINDIMPTATQQDYENHYCTFRKAPRCRKPDRGFAARGP